MCQLNTGEFILCSLETFKTTVPEEIMVHTTHLAISYLVILHEHTTISNTDLMIKLLSTFGILLKNIHMYLTIVMLNFN